MTNPVLRSWRAYHDTTTTQAGTRWLWLSPSSTLWRWLAWSCCRPWRMWRTSWGAAQPSHGHSTPSTTLLLTTAQTRSEEWMGCLHFLHHTSHQCCFVVMMVVVWPFCSPSMSSVSLVLTTAQQNMRKHENFRLFLYYALLYLTQVPQIRSNL